MKDQLIIEEKVEALAGPMLDGMGMELVDVEYRREAKDWVLRLFIDKEGGVTLDDCSEVSRELGEMLDAEDVIPHAYSLEVSSPGLDRPLKKEADFKRFTGSLAKIKTSDSIGKARNFRGRIEGCKDGIVSINVDGTVHGIPVTKIVKANIEYEFDQGKPGR